MKNSPPRALLLTCVCLISLWCTACSGQAAEPTGMDEMVLVPAGWFRMGRNEGPAASRPEHRVYLDEFWIDRTEVTVAAYERFVQAVGALPEVWRDGQTQTEPWEPIAGVLWNEARAYCEWRGVRLPTEAEWEKAARGTDARFYPWGNEWAPALTNTLERGLGAPVVVGSYPLGASPYGALDMAGNLQEWVADHYDPEYYFYAPRRNPQGPPLGLDHVLRGGSWASSGDQTTTYHRNASHSVRPNLRVGFRCAAPGHLSAMKPWEERIGVTSQSMRVFGFLANPLGSDG